MILHILNLIIRYFWNANRVLLNFIILDLSCIWTEKWFRDINRHRMSVTMYWRFSLMNLVILSLLNWIWDSSSSLRSQLMSTYSSVEQSTSGFLLWPDARSADDEWSRNPISSENDEVRTQYTSTKINTDTRLTFFFVQYASWWVIERSWRYWRTYVSISFVNFIMILSTLNEDSDKMIRESFRCSLLTFFFVRYFFLFVWLVDSHVVRMFVCVCHVDCLCDFRDVCMRSLALCTRCRIKLFSVRTSQNWLRHTSDSSSPYFTWANAQLSWSAVCLTEQFTISVLVFSVQIVVSPVIRCKMTIQGVSSFVNFWPLSDTRLHRRWRVSSKQFHVICHHSPYNVTRDNSRKPSRLRCYTNKRDS